MTESKFTSKLLKRLREHPDLIGRGAVVWKHCNYFTKGIPDFSVTIGARTTWWEVKRWGNPPTKIQEHYLQRIGIAGAETITMSKDGKLAIIGGGATFEFSGMDFLDLVAKIVKKSVAT